MADTRIVPTLGGSSVFLQSINVHGFTDKKATVKFVYVGLYLMYTLGMRFLHVLVTVAVTQLL